MRKLAQLLTDGNTLYNEWYAVTNITITNSRVFLTQQGLHLQMGVISPSERTKTYT